MYNSYGLPEARTVDYSLKSHIHKQRRSNVVLSNLSPDLNPYTLTHNSAASVFQKSS